MVLHLAQRAEVPELLSNRCLSAIQPMMGVLIRWNGLVEWNSGMEYWNGGMLQRAYLIKIIQHIIV